MLTLKLATLNDTDIIWNLRNDVATRRELGLMVISFSECLDWIANIVEGKSKETLLVAKDDKLGIVGFVTLRYDNDVARIGISIGSAFRGQGHGQHTIKLATEYEMGLTRPMNRRLLAHIRSENYKALFAFESAGYKESGTIKQGQHEYFIYEYK